jgi:uncharacterized membrane protein YidH (DUF202 family)
MRRNESESSIDLPARVQLVGGEIQMADTHVPVKVDASTQLAAERTRLAYERTLMAWVRTGTSLITFGFTIYKFFEEFRKAEPVARPA